MNVRVLMMILFLAFVAGCGRSGTEEAPPTAEADGPIKVVVTVPPLAWVAEAVLGDRAEVTVLLPEGASPHGWEPTPSDVTAIRASDAILIAGGADSWIFSIVDSVDKRILSMDADHDHHPWLDPVHVGSYSASVLVSLDERTDEQLSVSESAFRSVQGLRQVDDALLQTAALVGASVNGVLNQKDEWLDVPPPEPQIPALDILVITGHDAWSAFFGSIGIEDVIAVKHGHGGEPASSSLIEVRERISAAETVLVVLEPGEDNAWLESLADEFGAPTVVLDPVGTRDWPGDMIKRYEAVRAAVESFR